MSHPCGAVGSLTKRQKAGPDFTLGFPEGSRQRPACFLGRLLLIMLISSPVFHNDYVSTAILPVPVLLSMILDNYAYANIPFRWKAVFFVLFCKSCSDLDRSGDIPIIT